jgi:tetratricopeptide (TPR) repeat protein
MVALPTPFEAYQLDLGRLGVDDDLCAADSMWLLVAHCLSRFANQPETARLDLAGRCAMALQQFAASATDGDGDDSHPLDETALGDLGRLIEALQKYGERSGQEMLARAVLDMSARMSALGALTLAYTLVGSTREAVRGGTTRMTGLLLAEQARITRLLGQLDEAEGMYAAVRGLAERSGDLELEARSSLGSGVVAQRRGNYPKARECFERGLSAATRLGHRNLEAIAHQGLTITALGAQDYDGALRHGWETLNRVAGDSAREAEAFVNLANASMAAGYPRAALHALLRSLHHSKEHRVVVTALGNAALAAAQCGEVGMVEMLGARLERTMAESELPYENAYASYDYSKALDMIGQSVRADSFRDRVRAIAQERNFFELLHCLETDEPTRRTVPPLQRCELEETTQSVVRELETMECELLV